jgi:hypothetical protein
VKKRNSLCYNLTTLLQIDTLHIQVCVCVCVLGVGVGGGGGGGVILITHFLYVLH